MDVKELFRQYKLGIIAIIVLLIVALPLTILQLNKQQENRSHAAGEQISMILAPNPGTGTVGQPLNVQVSINAATNQITAADITFIYDSSILTFTSFTPAAPFQDTTPPGTGGLGTFRFVGIVAANATPPTGSSVPLGTIVFTGKAAGTATVGFSNVHVNDKSTLTALPLGTAQSGKYTITATEVAPTTPPQPTATPTSTAPTPTSTPAPTGPTPTGGQNGGGSKSLSFKLSLPGIGASASGNLNINNSPKRPNRDINIKVINAQNVETAFNGNIPFNKTSGKYEGRAGIGSALADGPYTIKVRMDNTLWKAVPGIIQLTNGTNTLPEVTLVTGDVTQDNQMNIDDYNALTGCFGKTSCTNFAKIDLNDDGVIDDLDLNLMIAAFLKRNGD